MKTFRKIVLAGLIGLSSLVPNLSSADYLNNGRLLAVAETKNVRECLFYSRYGNDRVVAIDSDNNGKVDRIQRLSIPKPFGDMKFDVPILAAAMLLAGAAAPAEEPVADRAPRQARDGAGADGYAVRLP